MKLTNYYWLQSTEYAFITLSALGAIAAAATQQVIYATVPLTVALSLNVNNTKRLQQQTQSAIATADQVKLNEQSKIEDVNELQQMSEQLQQQFTDFALDKQTSLADLTLQLAELRQFVTDYNKNADQEFLTKLQNEIQAIQQDNTQRIQQTQHLEQSVEKLQLRYQIVGYLSSEIRDLKQQKRQASQQIAQQLSDLEKQVDTLNQSNQHILTNIQTLESSAKLDTSLKLNKIEYVLNNFEKLVAHKLQNHFTEQVILTEFDVGKGGSSKCVDFALVLQNCIIIIEAKGYKGKIIAQGEPRNSRWMCQTGKQEILINACWGENPYKQVKVYVDSFLQHLRNKNLTTNIPVYGVVVFPEAAEVADDISNDIGGFFRVTTLDQLATTISSLNEQASFKNRSRLSYKNVLESLVGSSETNVA